MINDNESNMSSFERNITPEPTIVSTHCMEEMAESVEPSESGEGTARRRVS